MSSENVYLIAAADHLAGAVKHSVQHDQPRKLSQLKQDVERGLRIFESWMEDHGGRVLLFQGDRVFAEIPGENLESLPDLHAQVQDAWNDTITIGVGLDLTEAEKARENGRKRGGKRIVFYAPEVEQHLAEESASESHDATTPESDPDELKSMALNKGDVVDLDNYRRQRATAVNAPLPEDYGAALKYQPPHVQAFLNDIRQVQAKHKLNLAFDDEGLLVHPAHPDHDMFVNDAHFQRNGSDTGRYMPEDDPGPENDPWPLSPLGKSLAKANTPSPGPPTPNEPQPSFSQGGLPSPQTPPSPFAAGQAQPSGADMPPPPSSTNAAAGLSPVETQMREMASQGEAQGARAENQAATADDGSTGPDQLKQGISRILLKVKEQAQVLEQLKAQAPEAYKAILGMVQIVATIGKQLVPPKGEGQDQGQEEGAPITKSYIIESDDDVHQLRRSYQVEGVETAPLKSTGINNQVRVQDRVYPTNKEELVPHQPLPPPGRLDKIRKAAMAKKATGDAVTAAPPGLDVTAGIRKYEWKPTHCETKDCPNPAEENSHQCVECNKKYPFPYRSPVDPDEETGLDKALPMPEAGAHAPPKASGSLLSRLRGDASPQAHKFFHQTPGQAAHVGMDGKPEGKNVVRQFQSGMVKPINNRAETDTGSSHPVSALNPTDSEGRGGQ